MTINIGIASNNRKTVAGILGALLADEYVLYTKVRNFHWNVTGPHFSDYHKFFEAQYEEINDAIDEIAERIRSLGEVSAGSLKEFLSAAKLKEMPGRAISGRKMMESLLKDHETVIQSLRRDLEKSGDKYHDMGTSDFLTGLMEQHEKMAWMVRAHLDNPS